MHAVDCVKEFLRKGLPQAIVCANDTMAIFVIDYLKNEGYKVPKDIIVTGFDGNSDAFTYEPSLTTVRHRYEYAGSVVFEMIEKLINGITHVKDETIKSELILQESCGCKTKNKKDYDFIVKKYQKRDAFTTFTKQMVRSDIYFFDDTGDIDLLIEYQGYYTHGNHPFDANNIDDKIHLNELKVKYKSYYDENGYWPQIITIWTEKDVEKRNTAKKNKLNYIEFYSLEEVEEWIKLQTKK